MRISDCFQCNNIFSPYVKSFGKFFQDYLTKYMKKHSNTKSSFFLEGNKEYYVTEN